MNNKPSKELELINQLRTNHDMLKQPGMFEQVVLELLQDLSEKVNAIYAKQTQTIIR